MATRFLAGKLLAAALRRRTAVSKSAAAPSSSAHDSVSCVWYTHNHRKAVREVFRELEPELKHEILGKYSSPSN
uniref:Uncharacterized protein n=1 Tax=Oryza sativa subsp. japonica TaxID=39947 RepID=Q7XIY8_ORYSJ|nr:hypothetical protein [Oryza sativa Japonica Group]BAD31909.1 hypothetical protein [Oryza sativa Japonica Group]